MVSRGTADLGGAKGAAPIKKAKPAGPQIAEIPRFKAPPSTKTPKPEEAAPQRPVQRFTADGPQKEAPLGQILRKRPDSTVKKKAGRRRKPKRPSLNGTAAGGDAARRPQPTAQSIDQGHRRRRRSRRAWLSHAPKAASAIGTDTAQIDCRT